MKSNDKGKSPKRRLRRYVADPKAYAERHGARTGRARKAGHTASFQLTDRDREILRMVLRYRFVTIDHVHALITGNNRQISRRVQAMFHLGYLTRYLPTRRLRVGLYTPGSEKMIYGLDTVGWRELEVEQQRAGEEAFAALSPAQQKRLIAKQSSRYLRSTPSSPERARELAVHATVPWWRKDHSRRAEWHIYHHLEISDFHAVLELAVAGRPELELVDWRQSRGQLRDTYRYQDRDTGESKRESLEPDAYFSVVVHGERQNFFLELDRGTEEHGKLQAKFQAYQRYVRSTPYLEGYVGTDPENLRVLFVTTPEKGRMKRVGEAEALTRLQRMLDSLTKIRGKRSGLARFWFTTTDAYNLSQPEGFLEPIWTLARFRDGERLTERRSLFS